MRYWTRQMILRFRRLNALWEHRRNPVVRKQLAKAIREDRTRLDNIVIVEGMTVGRYPNLY